MALSVALIDLIGRTILLNPPDEKIFPMQAQKTSTLVPLPFDWVYKSIANISYLGDIRNTLSIENANKVDNIVDNNKDAFYAIYEPLLRELSSSLIDGSLQIVNQK